MGDAPKRGDGSDLPGAVDVTLIDVIKKTERNARATKPTVKGMVPLQRPPAPAGSDPADE